MVHYTFLFFYNQLEHVIDTVFVLVCLVVVRFKEWSLNPADIDFCLHTIVPGYLMLILFCATI